MTLAPRQIECLSRIAAGQTSEMIARDLGISRRTVDNYVRFACAKLGVRSRAHAVAAAMGLGLLQGPINRAELL